MTNKPSQGEKVKPCPFCGNTNRVQVCNFFNEGWAVHCYECRASGGMFKKTESEAITAWNTRSSHPTAVGDEELEIANSEALKRYPETIVQDGPYGEYDINHLKRFYFKEGWEAARKYREQGGEEESLSEDVEDCLRGIDLLRGKIKELEIQLANYKKD